MSLRTKLLSLIGRSAPRKKDPPSVLDILASHKRRTERTLPPPTTAGKMRIHLFAGHFASKGAAWHYCFYKENNRPEDLMQDLPDAHIDPAHVEIRFGTFADRLSEFLAPADVKALCEQIAPDNTLIIFAEPAFGGLAYALYDTPRLRYLGPLVVDI